MYLTATADGLSQPSRPPEPVDKVLPSTPALLSTVRPRELLIPNINNNSFCKQLNRLLRVVLLNKLHQTRLMPARAESSRDLKTWLVVKGRSVWRGLAQLGADHPVHLDDVLQRFALILQSPHLLLQPVLLLLQPGHILPGTREWRNVKTVYSDLTYGQDKEYTL
ncbi:hypothetical protein C0Q70_14149 [Pomacea canaliculata]|uniref:Uncharacterized protein n=1 Tax=Pomacea canaliculata TaxID=400727 RepID=A0A2T7NZ71_POMCA|nr:hypothetical protein C0Q70_14149 [Pomacea canaliculata]